MTRYFISYARSDGSEIANELVNRLRAIGHEAFLDTQGISGGDEWKKELLRSTKWTDVLLVLVTLGSNLSNYVYLEFQEAEKHHKTIVPIIVKDTPLPPYLAKYHALSLEGGFDALLLRLQTSTGSPGTGKLPLVAFLILFLVLIVIVAVLMLGLKQSSDPMIVTVDSRLQGWQSTGLQIKAGSKATIKVIGGSWTNWKGKVPYNLGMGWDYICGTATTPDKCGEPLPNARQGSLTGSIGSQFFEVGSHTTITATHSGILSLGINDDPRAFLDNDGTLTVSITVEN